MQEYWGGWRIDPYICDSSEQPRQFGQIRAFSKPVSQCLLQFPDIAIYSRLLGRRHCPMIRLIPHKFNASMVVGTICERICRQAV